MYNDIVRTTFDIEMLLEVKLFWNKDALYLVIK